MLEIVSLPQNFSALKGAEVWTREMERPFTMDIMQALRISGI